MYLMPGLILTGTITEVPRQVKNRQYLQQSSGDLELQEEKSSTETDAEGRN